MPEATHPSHCTPPDTGDSRLSLSFGGVSTSPGHFRDIGRVQRRGCAPLETPEGGAPPVGRGSTRRHGDRDTDPTDGGRAGVHITHSGGRPGGEA
jgi:hypothetical protein